MKHETHIKLGLMSASYSAPKMSFGHIGKVTLSEWRFYSINFIIYLFFLPFFDYVRCWAVCGKRKKNVIAIFEATILSNHEFFCSNTMHVFWSSQFPTLLSASYRALCIAFVRNWNWIFVFDKFLKFSTRFQMDDIGKFIPDHSVDSFVDTQISPFEKRQAIDGYCS